VSEIKKIDRAKIKESILKMNKNIRRPKVGLALGSGGPRGLAHIGVIKVLEENNIPIDFIAGCSIGSMIGGLYALTKDINWIEKMALETGWRRIVSLLAEPALLSGGLVGGEKIEKFILEQTGRKKFEDLKIPFIAVATDINTGKEVRIKKGDLAKAIRISCSVPLVFKPAEREDKLLVDGGLSNPVPDDVVRKMGADVVIAVNLDAYFSKDGIEIHNNKLGIYAMANQTINVLRYHLAQYSLQDADVIIIPKVGRISWARFAKGRGIIKKGETEAQLAMPKIKKCLNRSSRL